MVGLAGSAGFVRNEQKKVRVSQSVGGYGRKEEREDGRNRQFGEIERDPEILLLFQSGIRNLAEWERAKEREKRREASLAAAALGSSVVVVCGGCHCDG